MQTFSALPVSYRYHVYVLGVFKEAKSINAALANSMVPVLEALGSSSEDQRQVIGSLELLCTVRIPSLKPQFPLLLKLLYDTDFMEEVRSSSCLQLDWTLCALLIILLHLTVAFLPYGGRIYFPILFLFFLNIQIFTAVLPLDRVKRILAPIVSQFFQFLFVCLFVCVGGLLLLFLYLFKRLRPHHHY